MTRRKLIFFCAADPAEDIGPAISAYHMAGVAAGAGLAAEVRLAGDGVRVALPGGVPATEDGDRLREKMAQGRAGLFDVSI